MYLYMFQTEYALWWSKEQILRSFQNCPDDTAWNVFVCVQVLASIVLLATDVAMVYYDFFDVFYNVVYAVHVLGVAYNLYVNRETTVFTFSTALGFLVDVLTYFHYFLENFYPREAKLLAYYLRLHRPFRYLWALNDYNLKSSVLGTALKYCYIFFVLRITWALVWMQFQEEESHYDDHYWRLAHEAPFSFSPQELLEQNASEFLRTLYLVNKMFIPIGPSTPPKTDTERVLCLMVMITGGLTVSGCAVASLSLVIGIYMRPEERFRARFRLIMRDMEDSAVSASLSEKVQTFYKMYWHKQKAVSTTQLLPTFPPWIPSIVYTDIYFKATQKARGSNSSTFAEMSDSRILSDLSYQFLCEIVKNMQTLHYIPGDTIIKRSTQKSSIIYISYGDIEMLTAEDDSTAMLRMSRGTVLGPCAGCPPAGCGRAHVDIRAATFCTAHVLRAGDLWRTAHRFGRSNGQAAVILASFYVLYDLSRQAKYKSSIWTFKRNLMELKKARDSNGNLLLARTDIMLEIAGCYIMRNRADSSLTDESDAICLRSTFPCILQPRSVLQTMWNSFVCCLIVVVCFTHPYYIAYKERVPIEFRFYDYVVTCIYLLDIFVYLSTGANVEDGVPITLLQTASQQIRSHWFVLDVVATMPLFEFIHDGHFAGINKLLRLPKVFRMLKSLEDDWVYYSNFLRFLSYSLLLVIACYLVAALQQTFMCFCFSHCSVTNFTHPPFWAHVPPDDAAIGNSLTFGLYWAASIITFTTHKETCGMSNWNTVLYTMLVLELCIVLHIFIEAVYSATIMVTTAMREDYDACIADVTNFLIRNDVEPVLRQRFITYLQLCWYTDKGYSITNKNSSIYHDLPPHVYQDIVNKQRSKYILCIPFMKYLSKEDLKTVSTKAVVFCTSPNEIILHTGDVSNEMSANFLYGACRDPRANVLHIKEVFTECHEIPQIRDAIDFAKEQPEFGRLLVRRQPFMSYKPPAPVPNVERFRLPRKHEQDHAFLQPFKKLGFMSVLRYMFPRFTIRPDGEYLLRAEWCRGCCALLSALIIPGYPYLSTHSTSLDFMVFMLDCTAYFDILQRMLVGYYNVRGTLVYHPLSTADRYIRGAFLVDLFACLPLEMLETVVKELYPDRYRITVAVQYLVLNRLLQLYRLPGAIQGLERYMRRDIVLVIKATPLFLGLLNVMTCFLVFYSVDIYISMNNYTTLIIPRQDHGGSWVNLFQQNFRFNLTENTWNLHLACYFWVVYEATTTGYSSMNPSNLDIMKMLFTGMVVGAMITTYFSVRIISIRSNVNNPLAAFQQHMKDMAAFMRREKLGAELKRDVLAYYACNWEKTGGQDYRHVLKLCDQITLRSDAILHIYGPTFAMCPILGQCDVSLLRIIGRAMRSVHFLKGTRIVEKDDVIKDLCFLDSGTVELVSDERDPSKNVKLTKGSIFGDLDGEPSYRSPVHLISTSKVHVLQMNAMAFYTIIRDFPDVVLLLKTYRPNNENYILGNLSEDSPKVKNSTLTISAPLRRPKGLFKYLRLRNSYVQWYLIVVSLLCIYGDLYNAGFQDNRTLLVLALYSLDVAFSLKFLILFVTLSVSGDGNIRRISLSKKRCCKTETKCDILSCIPLELFCFVTDEYRGLLFSFCRLNRLLRLVTVYAGIRRHHERLSIDISLTTIYSVLVWFTLLVHGTACLWHFIGYVEDIAKPNSSWMYKDDGSSWCRNLYVCSLYFVITTCSQNGVGDIMPKNKSEVLFASILQIISIMLFMIYVGEVSNIIQYQSYRSFDFYCKYLELQDFLRNNRVSKNLVKLVNRYSLHLWRESRGVQVPHFLKTAPHCLRLRLMSASFMQHLRNLQGLVRELPYTNSYRTITKCQILTLRLNDWEDLLKHFPRSKRTIYENLDFDDSAPKASKHKKERRVTIINPDDEPPPDRPRSKARES
ncbi:unnamed protein product, partial [Iphiclides podalirius]